MSQARLLALGASLPGTGYTQGEIYDGFLKPYLGSRSHVRAIFEHTGIACRHTVVDGSYYRQTRGTQERNEKYLEQAVPLGALAIRNCLKKAGRSPQDIDDFVVVSCTGIDTPGLDLLLAKALNMRPDLQRTCILGMGCYAAFPGLRKAAQAVASSPGRLSLVLALELCSLHFQPQDTSLENVVSSALFADGAAAALLGEAALEESARAPAPRWLDFETHCDYQTLGHMAFHLTDTGFHMHLSAYVPKVLEADVQGLVDHLLHRNGLRREQVRLWGVHPGSSKILDYIQNRLGLADEQMICSRRVLHDCGNMSSPTILFVLDELQRQENPSPGDYGVLLAFGPGLTMESALLQW